MNLRSTPAFIITLFLAAATFAQQPKPAAAPVAWQALIGEYTRDSETIIVLEKDQKLYALSKRDNPGPMRELSENEFYRDRSGKVSHLKNDSVIYTRKPMGPEEGANQLKVEPVRPVRMLIREALKA